MTTSPEEEAGRQVPTNKLRAGGADIAGSDSRVATTSPSHECGPSRCTCLSPEPRVPRDSPKET